MINSIIMCKARTNDISNISKVLINLGQIIYTSGTFGFYMTPTVATLTQCTALQYYTTAGNVLERVSLSALLLWRLNQIICENFKIDNFISITLLIAKIAISVSFLIISFCFC